MSGGRTRVFLRRLLILILLVLRCHGLEGQHYAEDRSLAHGACDVDLAVVVLHDALHQRKPQAGAIAFGGVERPEDIGQMFGRNAVAVVRYLDHGEIALRFNGDGLLKRLVSQELTLSFVPHAEQRLWRTVTRTKYQLRRNKVRLHNQLEALLEEAHIKLSSLVSDLLGASARRMLQALAEGETDPAALAALADQRLRATSTQLRDALGACTELNPVYRRLVKMVLEELQWIEQQIGQLDQEMASLLRQHQDAVQRLAEVPGLGVDSAQQIIAEVGAKAATFASAKNLSSWVGACPGEEESAEVNYSARSPKGNRHMRRLLNQAANAAVKVKGSIFEIVYRRLVPRLGHNKTIGAIAHRICQLIWIILNKGARHEERGPAVSENSRRARTSRMIRTLRKLGYRVELQADPA